MTREAAFVLLNSVRANVSTIYRISFAGIAHIEVDVWVILRRLIPDALELVAANADHWHSDFVIKLWITFHPQLAPVPSRQVFIMLAQELSHSVQFG
jgi:hypothetical protein